MTKLGDLILFRHSVEHVKCTSELSALTVYYDEGVGDSNEGGLEVALVIEEWS